MKPSKRLLLSVVFAIPFVISGQITRFSNFQTPEVASLGTYGNIPVGMFTGTPNISVPLFDINVGSYTMPITASYHLANVRPFPTPGILGLGWNLEAGGYITRTVRGFPDEKKDSHGNDYGFLGHYWKMASVTSRTAFVNALNGVFNAFVDNTESNEYELMSDEYSFSFCGHSGRFYLNSSGEWVVVSDEDIKVLFSLSENTVNLNQLEQSGRLNTTGWTNKNQNHRFITGFTLVTPDGCRYEFGGLDATEFSIPYYNRGNCDLVATTWHLARIATPEGREINLSYKCKDGNGRALIMCDLRYSPNSLTYGNYNSNSGTLSGGYYNINMGWLGFTGFLLFPSYLERVTTPNENVLLSYKNDGSYSNRLLQDNYSCQALYRSNKNVVMSRFGLFVPALQFFMFMDGVDYDGSDHERRQRLAARMSDLMLDSITVSSSRGGGRKKAVFNYINHTHTSRRKMTQLTIRYDNQTHQRYAFNYNTEGMYEYYPMAATDSWGYSTGGHVAISETPTFNYVPSSQEALTHETLSEIIYPTGGKSCFFYEPNTYSKRASYSSTHLISGSGMAGGLRVSRIVNRKSNGHIDNIRRFFYCDNIADSMNTLSASSGVLSHFPMHIKNILSTNGDFLAIVKSKDAFSVPVTADETPSVGYSCVIEQTLGSDGSSLGWVRKRFSNYDTDPYGTSHHDEQPTYRLVESDSVQVSPVTSLSYERGKLMSEEFFDATGTLVRKTCHKYGYTIGSPLPTMNHEESLYYYPDETVMAYMQSGCLTNTHTRRLFEISVEDSIITPSGVFSTKKSTAYNTMKLPMSATIMGSDAKDRKEIYAYAYEKASSWGTPYSDMAEKHMLTPLESVTKLTGTQTREIEAASFAITPNAVPYVSSSSIYQDTGRTIGKEQYKVMTTDGYGNPLEIMADSLVSILVWAYQGQRQIARVDNVPLGTAALYNQWLLSLSARDPIPSDYEAISQLRSSMPNSHFQIYHYDGWLNLVSITTPDGYTTYYKHDPWGRLREEYFYDTNGIKHILNQYDYHYDN